MCCQTKMAIDSINQLTSLTERRPTTASGTFKNSKQCTCSGGKRQLTTSKTTFVHQAQPGSSALAELQRRFPKVSRRRAAANRDPVSGIHRRRSNSISRPYQIVQNVRRYAGRPTPQGAHRGSVSVYV